jgi:hypothetical protein
MGMTKKRPYLLIQPLFVVDIGLFFILLLCFKHTPERWESGLIHQFAKLAYSIGYRGFESPPLRNTKITRSDHCGFCFARSFENKFS